MRGLHASLTNHDLQVLCYSKIQPQRNVRRMGFDIFPETRSLVVKSIQSVSLCLFRGLDQQGCR